ncbi:hypothetical protein F4821DRAFT_11027 [Hypoxylon rubiginosum]|uniref:Uncharacterized protein n=1 Tax=Hypoxylon rubiginosum TaxID=110542 RepID=A0ACC0DDS8_9PEZI|nr:hypothetical protein F4821DRAFT_11027 [Hypoxylon rubiginosum]
MVSVPRLTEATRHRAWRSESAIFFLGLHCLFQGNAAPGSSGTCAQLSFGSYLGSIGYPASEMNLTIISDEAPRKLCPIGVCLQQSNVELLLLALPSLLQTCKRAE